MSPESGSRMPATARSRTVLPAPDGPQTTTVSPALTARSTPSSTMVRPKLFLTPMTVRSVMTSPLHGAEGQPLDQIALGIERQGQGGQQGHHDGGGDLPVLDAGPGDQGDRKRVV